MAETQQNQLKSKLLSAQRTLLTVEDLWKQPDDGYRYELVKGIMRRMPPAGFEHGIRSAKIGGRLNEYVERHKLGYVCGAETGFKISQAPDTVQAPDAAFVRQTTEVAEKVDEWLNAECAMVWVVNPRRETAEVYRSPEDITVLQGDDILEGSDVIGGFQRKVGDLFL